MPTVNEMKGKANWPKTLSILVGAATSLVAAFGLVAVQELEGLIQFGPIALVPPVVLAFAVRRPRTAVISSIVTLALSTLPWTIVALGDDDWLGLVIVGYPIVFLTCAISAVLDQRVRRPGIIVQ